MNPADRINDTYYNAYHAKQKPLLIDIYTEGILSRVLLVFSLKKMVYWNSIEKEFERDPLEYSRTCLTALFEGRATTRALYALTD